MVYMLLNCRSTRNTVRVIKHLQNYRRFATWKPILLNLVKP